MERLKAAWEMYKAYCDEAKVSYPLSQRAFKEELKNYFKQYDDRLNSDDGMRVQVITVFFKTDVFETNKGQPIKTDAIVELYQIDFQEQPSIFDAECKFV